MVAALFDKLTVTCVAFLKGTARITQCMCLIRAAEPIPAKSHLLQYILFYKKKTLQLPYFPSETSESSWRWHTRRRAHQEGSILIKEILPLVHRLIQYTDLRNLIEGYSSDRIEECPSHKPTSGLKTTSSAGRPVLPLATLRGLPLTGAAFVRAYGVMPEA